MDPDETLSEVTVAGEPELQGDGEQEPEAPFSMPPPPADLALNKLLLDIGRELATDDLEDLKTLFSGSQGGIGKKVLEAIKSPRELFKYLKEYDFLRRENIIFLQSMLNHIGRKDLLMKAIAYAKSTDNVLHFFQPSSEPANGYRHAKFHVEGTDFAKFSQKKLNKLRATLSKWLLVPPQCIFIRGIEPSSSLLITIMMPAMYVETLEQMVTEEIPGLLSLGIDTVFIDGKPYRVDGVQDVALIETEQQRMLRTTFQQLQEKTERLEDRDVEVINLRRELEQIKKDKKAFDINVGLMVQFLFEQFEKEHGKNGKNGTHESPLSLQQMCKLTRFRYSLKKVRDMKYDMAVIEELLDANNCIVASREREFQALRVQRLELLVQSMRSELFAMQYERDRLAYCLTLEKQSPLQENQLTGMLQFLIQTILAAAQVKVTTEEQEKFQISPVVMVVLKRASRDLREKDKKKLRNKYTWKQNEGLKEWLRDNNLFLPCIVYKEVETKQRPVDIYDFVSHCLDEVDRQDLRKRFTEDFKKIAVKPLETKIVETLLESKVDKILEKVTAIEKNLQMSPYDLSFNPLQPFLSYGSKGKEPLGNQFLSRQRQLSRNR